MIGQCRFCKKDLNSQKERAYHNCNRAGRVNSGVPVPRALPIASPAPITPNAELQEQLPPQEQQDEDTFDPNFDFLRLATNSNLTRPQTEGFIQFIKQIVEHTGGTLDDKFTLHNAAAVDKLRDDLILSIDDGWQEHEIVVTPEESFGALEKPYSVTFHCRDLADLLQKQCSNPEFNGSFCLHPKKRYVEVGGQRQRVFDEVYHCDAAINAFEKVKEHAEGVRVDWETMRKNAVALLLQAYSDKTLVNVKGTSCHGIRMALLNLPYAMKIDNMEVVAYFPSLPGSINRLVKLLVISKCLQRLFAPLAEPSHRGVEWAAPNGKKYVFFPRLISYVADDPEIRDILCILAHNSLFPCEKCLVSPEDLGAVLETIIPRTAKTTKAVVEYAKEKVAAGEWTRNKAIDKIARAYGITPILSGLFTLFGDYDESGESNFHDIFGFDTMHNEDLGLMPDLVTAACNWIREKWPKGRHRKIFILMNEKIKKIPRTTGFVLPSNEYFPNFPHAQAIEHRSLLQVFPHILQSLLPTLRNDIQQANAPLRKRQKTQGGDANLNKAELLLEFKDIIHAFANYAVCYAECQRKFKAPSYTEHELNPDGELQNAIIQFHDSFVKALADYLPSGGCTIKRHRLLTHFVDTVRLLGHPRNYSSQSFEAQHKYDKRAYKNSGRRPNSVVEGIIRHNKIARLFTLPEQDRPSKPRRSAAAEAKDSEQHTIVLTGEQVRMSDLKPQNLDNVDDISNKIATLLSSRPDLKYLSGCLEKFLSVPANSLRYLTDATRSNNPRPEDTIILVNNGVLAATTVPYHTDKIILQTIRATGKYGAGKGIARFDHCIASIYRSQGRNAREETECIVQVRALFWCTINGIIKPFAFVYEMKKALRIEVGNSSRDTIVDVLDTFGCIEYEAVPEALPDICPKEYKVIPLKCLKRRVDLVPPLVENGKYRLNTFSWQAWQGCDD